MLSASQLSFPLIAPGPGEAFGELSHGATACVQESGAMLPCQGFA